MDNIAGGDIMYEESLDTNIPEPQTDVDVYGSIKTDTEKIVEELKKKEQETQASKQTEENELKITDIAKAFLNGLKENKSVLLMGLIFIAIGIMTITGIIKIAISILNLNEAIIATSPLVNAVLAVLPFGVWAWSTKYDFYNYHTIKRFLFRLSIVNAIVTMGQLVLRAELRILLPFLFLIPTNGSITYKTIVMSAYMFLLALFIAPLAIITYQFIRLTFNSMTDRWLITFYISTILPDTRKDKKFAYDIKVIRRLDSLFKKQVIYMKDRFLHFAGIGSTGTGKTSAIMTTTYESDLQQKAFNTDYQKKEVERLLEQGKAKLTRNFVDADFNIDFITGDGPNAEAVNKELEELKFRAPSAGYTVFCPNAAFADELYTIAKAKKHKVNRVDPALDEKTGTIKDDWIGFNPLYVPFEEDKQRYFDKVFTAAKLYSDVNQAVFELSGKGDPYFTSLNRSLSVTGSITMIITVPHVHPGRYATPEDVQEVINNFDKIKPYRDKLVELYGIKNELGHVVTDIGRAQVIPELQFILARIDRDFLGANAPKISEQATGLRNIIDDSLMNPRIRKILCSQETIDLDKILENGEITLVNFEISMGSDSTGFGMFFLLSFIQAVLRRKGNENTRIPHFAAIDEAPWLFHPKIETSLTLFRQYRCGMMLFLQSLSQLDKNDTTRYLKQVMIGNCATQVLFGRAAAEEMDLYERLAGTESTIVDSSSVRETALSDENTQKTMTTSSSIENKERYSSNDIRYRQFLECTVLTVRNSTLVRPFTGKVNFLPKRKRRPITRYVVDWSKYYREIEEDTELHTIVRSKTEVEGTADSAEEKMERKGLLSSGTVEASTTVTTTGQKEDDTTNAISFSLDDAATASITTSDESAEQKTEESPTETFDGSETVPVASDNDNVGAVFKIDD